MLRHPPPAVQHGSHRARVPPRMQKMSMANTLHSTLVLLLMVLLVLIWGASSFRPVAVPEQTMKTLQQHDELLAVQAVFRHGARTPLSTMYWPDTEYADCSSTFKGAHLDLLDETGAGQEMSIVDMDMPHLPGGCRMGQLTADGYQLALNLGAWLRKRYVQQYPLLSHMFQPEQVYLRSTRYHRTVQTLQGVLTGLWPELATQDEAITVFASPENLEFEYGNNKTCPSLAPISEQLLQKVKARDSADADVAKDAAAVAAALGLAGGAAAVTWVRLHDTLACMAAHHSTSMPDGATEELIQLINHRAVRDEAAVLAPQPSDNLIPAQQCPHVVQLSIGPLIWHLLDNMQRHAVPSGMAVSQVPRAMRAGLQVQPPVVGPPQLLLYSGHDSTITPLLAALGRPEQVWPPFTANIVLELWRKDGLKVTDQDSSLWVRVLYNHEPLAMRANGDDDDTTAGRHRAADGWISLSRLQQRLAPFMLDPEQHIQQCTAPAA